jgi:hypothetical protein
MVKNIVAMNPISIIPCQPGFGRGKAVHAELCGELGHFHPQRSHFAECLGPAVPVCKQMAVGNFTFDELACERDPPCRNGLTVFREHFDPKSTGMSWLDLLNSRCRNLGSDYSLRFFSEDCRHSHRALSWVPRMPWARLCENEPCPSTCVSLQTAECPPLSIGRRIVRDVFFKLILPLFLCVAVLAQTSGICKRVGCRHRTRVALNWCWDNIAVPIGSKAAEQCPKSIKEVKKLKNSLYGVVLLVFLAKVVFGII